MKIIDGKLISNEIRKTIKKETENLKMKNIIPGLGIILVGHDLASEIYVRNKIKTCEELGVNVFLYRFDESDQERNIIELIESLNRDDQIDGILVQSPLPESFSEHEIIRHVNPKKAVDGFGIYQLGSLLSDQEELVAATPLGILTMLEHEQISAVGKHVVVVGSSLIVGRPMAALLLNRGATVTIAHNKTQNLKEITKMADILIVAIGHAQFINEDYVKNGVVIIDVGINRVDGKIYGDVDFDSVKDKCSYITPVPGGVGPMTITMLLYNVVLQAKRREEGVLEWIQK